MVPPFAVFARFPEEITRNYDGGDMMPCRSGTMIRRIGFITRAPVIRRNFDRVGRCLSSAYPSTPFVYRIFSDNL